LTPAETVGFLTTSNLYISAIQICEEFSLPLTGVIEALASRAVRIANARPQEKSAAWSWLAENRPGRNLNIKNLNFIYDRVQIK